MNNKSLFSKIWNEFHVELQDLLIKVLQERIARWGGGDQLIFHKAQVKIIIQKSKKPIGINVIDL